jgi:hypothetical protein
MRGSVTELVNNRGYGSILGEDGCELYFDENSLEEVDIRAVSVGDWVEYQEQYWGARVRAVKIRSCPSPKSHPRRKECDSLSRLPSKLSQELSDVRLSSLAGARKRACRFRYILRIQSARVRFSGHV